VTGYTVGDVISFTWEGLLVSIVRVGLSENKGFAEGYDAIFKKKKPAAKKSAPAAVKKPAKKKPAKKK
jgi:hypothetical protein